MSIQTQHFSSSPSFKQVVRGLVALHRLTKEGLDESTEADSIRDSMDGPLKGLNRIELDRARWLSEDLYAVSEPRADNERAMNPQAQRHLIEAYEARQRGEWDRALALLRRWKDFIAPALLSYLRASIWSQAGHPELAVIFYGDASDRDPANTNFKALYLHAMGESEPKEAGQLARDVLKHSDDNAPLVVAEAANIYFSEARVSTDGQSLFLYKNLIPILEKNLMRIDANEEEADRQSALALTVGLLGFCYEHLGNAGAAVKYYTRGLQVDPENAGLLVARGILLYGSSPRAILDLDRAVQLGSPLIWPYLLLSHHYLNTGQFESCRVMCEAGLRKGGSDTAKSQLEEWHAIAQAELGFPPELVRAAFEAAVRLDPSNELAARNRDAFEANLASQQPINMPSWERKSNAAVRQLGLSEWGYSLAA